MTFNVTSKPAVKERETVITIGTFDGVHLGHQEVIKHVTSQKGLESWLVTFDPHPLEVVNKEKAPFLITLNREKYCLVKNLGVENIYRIPFTRDLSLMPPEKFLKEYLLDKIKAKEIIIGYDHGFGKSRQGSVDFLKTMAGKFNFKLVVIRPVKVDGVIISSTKIRNALNTGAVENARKMLGRPYSLEGLVVKGDSRGGRLGFPTANLKTDPRKLIPGDGVYFVIVKFKENEFAGMMNIGKRPTFNSMDKTIEVHMLDFLGELYGETIEVFFYIRLRDEIMFKDGENLKTQLEMDRKKSMNFFYLYKSSQL